MARRTAGLSVVLFALSLAGAAIVASAQRQETPPIVGRWDIVVHSPEGDYPSWLEVTKSGHATLVGRFVGRFGSARPISQVFFENGAMRFSLPVQWEAKTGELRFTGAFAGAKLAGNMVDEKGKECSWSAVRAPSLIRPGEPQWGTPIELFNGRDLAGWKPHNPASKNQWVVRNGVLVNRESGDDLVTERTFIDFKVHAEFRYPKGSNSGIYLRGRYEAQIEDDYGRPPESDYIGGIYGFLQPRINAAKKAGEWQTYDITLVGREVSVILNGELVIDRQEIPGITGGALDSDEGAPGPLYIQGDHGPIEFRKFTVTPAL